MRNKSKSIVLLHPHSFQHKNTIHAACHKQRIHHWSSLMYHITRVSQHITWHASLTQHNTLHVSPLYIYWMTGWAIWDQCFMRSLCTIPKCECIIPHDFNEIYMNFQRIRSGLQFHCGSVADGFGWRGNSENPSIAH